jgi:hypothetical protein
LVGGGGEEVESEEAVEVDEDSSSFSDSESESVAELSSEEEEEEEPGGKRRQSSPSPEQKEKGWIVIRISLPHLPHSNYKTRNSIHHVQNTIFRYLKTKKCIIYIKHYANTECGLFLIPAMVFWVFC